MNICCVVHNFFPYFYTGTERYILNVSKQLQKMGHRVEVLTYGLKDQEGSDCFQSMVRHDYTYEGVPVVSFRHKTTPSEIHYRIFFPDLELCLTDYFTKGNFDLVQVAHPMRVGSSALKVAKSLGIPTVLTLTDFWFPCPRGRMYQPDFTICSHPEDGDRCISVCGAPLNVVKRYQEARQVFFHLADALLAPSRLLIEIFHRLGWGREITLVKHGYLYEGVPPSRNRKKVSGSLRVGYFGAVSHVKGVDYLIDCFKKVPGNNISLDIHGGYIDEKEFFDSLIKRAGNDPRIRFKGKYEIEELPRIMEDIDLVVVPSNTLESYGLVVIESMAHYTPVIASDVVGSAYEYIEHGVNGYIFNLKEPETLTRILESVANDPEIVENWRHNVKPPPRIEEEVFLLENIYSGLVSPDNTPAASAFQHRPVSGGA